jgi:hypothetical protein
MPKSASRRPEMFLILIPLMILLGILYFLQQRLPQLPRLTTPAETRAARNVNVWAAKQTGLYYCSDSKLYQKVEPGMVMTQEKALEGGYRPAGGKTCR